MGVGWRRLICTLQRCSAHPSVVPAGVLHSHRRRQWWHEVEPGILDDSRRRRRGRLGDDGRSGIELEGRKV